MSCVAVTNHARERTRQRVGLPKKVVHKNAERAFEEGISHRDLRGSIKRFVDGLYLQHRAANNIKIYCGNVYLFRNNLLITVLPLPPKYRKTADLIEKKKEQK